MKYTYPNQGKDRRFDPFGILSWLQWKFDWANTGPETTIGLAMVLLRPFAIVLNVPWFGGLVKHFRIGGRWDDHGVVWPTIAFKTMHAPLPHVKWRKEGIVNGYKSVLGILVMAGAIAAHFFGYSEVGDSLLAFGGGFVVFAVGIIHKIVKYAAIVQRLVDAFYKTYEKLPKEN